MGILLLVVGAVCLLPLLGVAVSSKVRSSRTAWLLAGIPTALVLFAGMSCVVSNAREGAVANAVERGDLREVRRLLEAGYPADSHTDPYDPYGSPTAVLSAISEERWDIVNLLIEHGAQDSYYGDDGLYEESAVGKLEMAGQKELARRLRKQSPPRL
ncbi:hypothetical protein EON82_11045 [bacterium]|nr:MAG: hypothetical protein EON82_11045 [bacterium]